MILDKLFFSFSFLLIIGFLMIWIFNQRELSHKWERLVNTILVISDAVCFAGFVITGILAIWF